MTQISSSTCEAILYTETGGEIDVSHLVANYTDTNSVGGVSGFSLTLPSFYKDENGKNDQPFLEIVKSGDLMHMTLLNWEGKVGPLGRSDDNTTMVGIIKSPKAEIGYSPQVQRRITMSGHGLAGALLNENINYYMQQGYLQGLFPALSQVPIEELNGTRLDLAMHNFLTKVAYSMVKMQRPEGTLETMLSSAIHSIDGEGSYDLAWGNYEGSFWSLMEQYAEKPVHELFATTWPADRFGLAKGQKKQGRAWGRDGALPVMIMRRAPFPYSEGGGGAIMDDWNALPLHDLTEMDSKQNIAAGSIGAEPTDTPNFFYLFPRTIVADEVFARTWVPAIINEDKRARNGYEPLSWSTALWGDDVGKEEAEPFFKRLNWRVATQHNRMDEYLRGAASLPLSPHIRIGDRVRLETTTGDKPSIGVFYVAGVQNSYSPAGARRTNLTLDRGLLEADYANAGWFTEGLVEYSPVKDELLPVDDTKVYLDGGSHRLKK